jgi:hypothetical protein
MATDNQMKAVKKMQEARKAKAAAKVCVLFELKKKKSFILFHILTRFFFPLTGSKKESSSKEMRGDA